ncbi:MAG: hypothetical protein O3B73_11170, partial [bacterium]|nr:hypothetical protein [bacterium]
MEFDHLNPGLIRGMSPQLGRLGGRASVAIDSISRAQIQVKPFVYAGTRIRGVKADLTYADNSIQIRTFSATLPGYATHLSGNGDVTFDGTGARAFARLVGATDLATVVGNSILGEHFTFDAHLGVNTGSARMVDFDLIGTAEGSQLGLDSLRIASQIDSSKALWVSVITSGSYGHTDLSGRVEKDGRLDLTVSGLLRNPAILGKWVGYAIGGDSLLFSGQIEGTQQAPVTQFNLKMPGLTVEGIPMVRVSVLGKWAYPVSGSVSVRADTLSWRGRTLTGVFLDVTRDHLETQFLFGSNRDQDDTVFLWGQGEERGKSIRVVADSMYIQASEIALSNRGPLEVTYDPSSGFRIGQFELSGQAGKVIARDHPDIRSAIEIELSEIDLRP